MTHDRSLARRSRSAGLTAVRSRPLVAAATAATALVYLAGSLAPFQLDVPRRIRNQGQLVGSTLVLPGTGMMLQPETVDRRLTGALDDGEVVVDVTVEAEPDQQGPARILSLSSGVHEQSLVLGQYDSSLEVRVRRPGTTRTGTPAASFDDALAPGRLHHIRVAVDPVAIVIEVDGVERWRRATVDALATWDPQHRFVLGNEHGGDRPWRGRILRASVSTREGRADLLATGVLPTTLWLLPDGWTGPWWQPWRPQVTQLLHGAVMLALGVLAAALRPGVPPRRLVGWIAALAATTTVAKFAVAGRHPSLADLLVDVAAGAIGVLAVRHLQGSGT